MVVLAALSVLFCFAQCSKGVNPDDLPRLELTAENVISKEVWLRVKFVNVRQPWEFVVERDGKQIAAGRTQKADTLVIDTTATPKRLHRYKVIQLEGGVRTLESDVLEVVTLDTTSHAVRWEVDTLGVRGTIFDVWAFARDNIWAVGEIYLRDSTGKEDPVLYNIAKWNGQKWQSERVFLAPTYSVFAFAPNDIWIGSGTPYHWNGQSWRGYVYAGEGFYLKKIWGTSSSNLFAVGSNGSIIRFNGSSWQRMESGTTVDLEDVWGIDEKHVWATGTNSRDGRCVILQFNGSSWSVLYDSFGKPPNLVFAFSSLWAQHEKVLYLIGGSRLRTLNLNDGTFRRTHSLGERFKYRIRGTKQNDIFEVGSGGEIVHDNGATRYLYPEARFFGRGSAFWYTVQPSREFVVIGGEFFTGLYGVPVVLRGYR
jgi:hypothetical protein